MADRGGKRGNYWDPRARVINLCEGVRVTKCISFDDFEGSADALVASGIIELSELPGQPGRGKVSVSYRPLGVEKGDRGWFHLPGYMTTYRLLDSMYRVRITVDPDEEAHRREIAEAQRAHADAECEVRRAERLRRRAEREAKRAPATRSHLRLVWSAPPERGP